MIPGVTDTSTTVPASSNIAKSFMSDKSQFLKLLVAQLKNQDPMNSQDPDKFTQQLTQFSQLEQLQNISTDFKALQSQQHNFDRAQSVSYIGKIVDVPGNDLFIAPDQPATLGFNVQKETKHLTVDIINSSNQIVRSVDLQNATPGSTFLGFDKKDRFGNDLPQGNYKFRVQSFDDDGNTANEQTMIRGIVSQVDFSGDDILVKVNGINIPASEVKAVYATA